MQHRNKKYVWCNEGESEERKKEERREKRTKEGKATEREKGQETGGQKDIYVEKKEIFFFYFQAIQSWM